MTRGNAYCNIEKKSKKSIIDMKRHFICKTLNKITCNVSDHVLLNCLNKRQQNELIYKRK